MPQDPLENELLKRKLPIKDRQAYQVLLDAFPAEKPVPPSVNLLTGNIGEATIPRPPEFAPEPLVMGPDLDYTFEALTKLFPTLKNASSELVNGPTSGSMLAAVASGLNPEDFAGTTLDGVTNLKTKEIGINPDRATNAGVLLHELSHAKGYDELDAQTLEVLLNRMIGKETPLRSYTKSLENTGTGELALHLDKR